MVCIRSSHVSGDSSEQAFQKHGRDSQSSSRSRSVGHFIITGVSVDFPFLGNSVVLVTHEELYGPNSEREENVHPPPPNLRGVV